MPEIAYIGGVITGEQLRDLRSDARLSQTELAAGLSISERTLRNWEKEGVPERRESRVEAFLEHAIQNRYNEIGRDYGAHEFLQAASDAIEFAKNALARGASPDTARGIAANVMKALGESDALDVLPRGIRNQLIHVLAEGSQLTAPADPTLGKIRFLDPDDLDDRRRAAEAAADAIALDDVAGLTPAAAATDDEPDDQ